MTAVLAPSRPPELEVDDFDERIVARGGPVMVHQR